MLYLLAQEATPDNMLDVLALPVGLTLAAWLIFYAGWWVENRLTKAPWKWLAIPPVGYAIYLGVRYVFKFQDPFYRDLVDSAGGGKKMIAAHYGSLVLPVLGLAGIILFHFFNHKLNLTPDE
jgi:hypothetical protein